MAQGCHRLQDRKPGAFREWSALAKRDGGEAAVRLAKADATYRAGIAALEQGRDEATPLLRRGAEEGPIDPSLYLPLARACRSRGAGDRARDFYRKASTESDDLATRDAATDELARLSPAIVDPFSTSGTPAPLSPWLALALLPLAVGGVPSRRTSPGHKQS